MADSPPLAESSAALVHAARTGGYGEAAGAFADLLAAVEARVRAGSVPAGRMQALAGCLHTLSRLQSWGDWVAIADLVEYELGPLVGATKVTR